MDEPPSYTHSVLRSTALIATHDRQRLSHAGSRYLQDSQPYPALLRLDSIEPTFYPPSMDVRKFDQWRTGVHRFAHSRHPRSSRRSARTPVPATKLIDATDQVGRLLTREALGEIQPTERRTQALSHICPSNRLTARTPDNSLAPLRRGDVPTLPGWEIIAYVGSPSLDSETIPDAVAPPEGVSAFIARVLDQLTLSAWLPAAVLTASLAVLLQFHRARSANVLHAIGVLTANSVRIIVVMIPLLVIATVVTQAFSFETIRTLEGYWPRFAGSARSIMIRWQVHRKESISKHLQAAYNDALKDAKNRIASGRVSESVFNAFRDSITGADTKSLPSAPAPNRDELIQFSKTWRSHCRPWHLAKIDHLLKQVATYPADDRILPTRLGNVMRTTEDNLKNTDGDIEGFVLRRYGMASRRIQIQHDQFRNRLEMYCTLVYVSVSLVLLTPIILAGSGLGGLTVTIVAGAFFALCLTSYQAAIASAGGYCAALKEMDKDPDTSKN